MRSSRNLQVCPLIEYVAELLSQCAELNRQQVWHSALELLQQEQRSSAPPPPVTCSDLDRLERMGLLPSPGTKGHSLWSLSVELERRWRYPRAPIEWDDAAPSTLVARARHTAYAIHLHSLAARDGSRGELWVCSLRLSDTARVKSRVHPDRRDMTAGEAKDICLIFNLTTRSLVQSIIHMSGGLSMQELSTTICRSTFLLAGHHPDAIGEAVRRWNEILENRLGVCLDLQSRRVPIDWLTSQQFTLALADADRLPATAVPRASESGEILEFNDVDYVSAGNDVVFTSSWHERPHSDYDQFLDELTLPVAFRIGARDVPRPGPCSSFPTVQISPAHAPHHRRKVPDLFEELTCLRFDVARYMARLVAHAEHQPFRSMQFPQNHHVFYQQLWETVAAQVPASSYFVVFSIPDDIVVFAERAAEPLLARVIVDHYSAVMRGHLRVASTPFMPEDSVQTVIARANEALASTLTRQAPQELQE